MPSGRATSHHLIWTRKAFGTFRLRHSKKAIIRLPNKLHERLHLENEPFCPVSSETIAKMNILYELHPAERTEDVYYAMDTICKMLLGDPSVPEADLLALKENIVINSKHRTWLVDNYPKLNL